MLCVGKLLGYRTQSFVSAHKRNQNRRVVSIAKDHLALNRENECTGPWASRFLELILLFCFKAQYILLRADWSSKQFLEYCTHPLD